MIRFYLSCLFKVKMKYIDAAISFFRDVKDNWSKEEGLIVTFKEVNTKLIFKASTWILFKDESGKIKLYEEGSIPYSDDLDLGGVSRDVLLAGAASVFLPAVAVPLIVASIFGLRGGHIVGSLAFQKLGWENTYLFVYDDKEECIFAIEFHYSNNKKFVIKNILQDIKYFIEELEGK